MSPVELLARMAEQRASWVDLDDGKRLKLARPPECELPTLIAGIGIEHVVKCAVDWAGFREADFLGAMVGGSDEVPFDRELWDAYVRDHVAVLKPVAEALRASVDNYLLRRAETAKNSGPSQT